MKKETVLKIFRVLFCAVFALMAFFVLLHPKKTQTNILNAILSDSAEDGLLIDLSLKHSGRFHVIFEAEDFDLPDIVQKEFSAQLDKNDFKPEFAQNGQFSELLKIYKHYSPNFLSKHTANELKNGNFETVKQESYERLYNPLGISLLPVEDDPFLLFGDYLVGLGSSENQGIVELNGKYYEVLTLNLQENIALSPSLLNDRMKKIVETKNRLEKEHDGVKIYLSGAPVHTYFASSKSMKEINIICILSSLFIVLICKFYFKSFKILLPIALSLFLGMFCGYILTSLFFDSIHILTFVFSTTLIGICVDYSLHFFAHDNNIRPVFKSLTMSMLTTVCAFLILLFSNIGLLRQIAVFTAGGLVFVYSFVVLFYPVICRNINPAPAGFNFPRLLRSKKLRFAAVFLLIFISAAGFLRLKFNDDIKDMYKPPKYLVNAEKLYSELNGGAMSGAFYLVNGSDMQNLLEKEEKITASLNQEDFIALSRFLPSKKQQAQNRAYIHELYTRELNDYAPFLTQAQKNKLLERNSNTGFLTPETFKFPVFNDFLTGENSSLVILKKQPPANEVKRALAENSGVKFIDLKNDISSRVEKCRISCIKLILPALMLLFAGLSLIYNPKNALKILLPSVCGGFITIGLLSLFNQPVNLFHVLALFLIAGFSLDYSIFRFNSLKNPALSCTKSANAVLISCATSVFSFLLLSFTSFKLISSLGFVLSLGLISSYVLSLLLINNDSKEPKNF